MPAKPHDLVGLIAALRAEYLAEIPVRLHVAYVPTHPEAIAVSEWSQDASGYLPSGMTIEVLDTGALGSPSWSPAMHARVGGVTGWGEAMVLAHGDYRLFPAADQLEGIRRWCASKHRAFYEHQLRPLCWILIRHVAFGGYSIGRAAELEGVSVEKALELMDTAARKWWGWLSNELNGIDTRRRTTAA